jgi:protein TonB
MDVSTPQEKPAPTPSNEPPPSDHLGLDEAGGAGGDAFGLVGNQGGRDILGGGGGSVFAWYAGVIKGEVLAKLSDDVKLRSGAFSVVVKIWVKSDGSVLRVQLAQSSGDRDRDRAIETDLQSVTRISQAPPTDMPQPISLRIVSRV